MRHAETSYAVHIAWQHAPDRDELLLTGPLGQGLAEAVRDDRGIRLTLANRRQYEAADWDDLSVQVFGIRLPLAALPGWLLGQTAASDGWRVDILEREFAAANSLPTLIELRKDDTDVRLKVDQWLEVR